MRPGSRRLRDPRGLTARPPARPPARSPARQAIAPFYVQLCVGGSGSALGILRVLRLARILRLFKLSRYSSGMRIFSRALSASAHALVLLLMFLAIAVVLFSSLIFFAERGEFDDQAGAWVVAGPDGTKAPSAFQSIPASSWWCIATLTTVGYGDVAPVTPTGKLIAAVTMLSGLLVLSLPMSVIGANFAAEMEAHQLEKACAGEGVDDLGALGAEPQAMTINVALLRQHLEAQIAETLQTVACAQSVGDEKGGKVVR